jgi:hypothetical protein
MDARTPVTSVDTEKCRTRDYLSCQLPKSAPWKSKPRAIAWPFGDTFVETQIFKSYRNKSYRHCRPKFCIIFPLRCSEDRRLIRRKWPTLVLLLQEPFQIKPILCICFSHFNCSYFKFTSHPYTYLYHQVHFLQSLSTLCIYLITTLPEN